ncbi:MULTISPECIES: hypothetical protein [Thiomicrorhabdus]|uniref:SoxXA-binding protein n=1 Tax=Thiomicrorhabdus heinhorstiae TaxID=2748010 RepID=A0ABS0BTH2_9GAMM|nr:MULTISPECIES: hypothetical protein [Thiomicrorhabdus]MBF6057138.1 hypothetical protein [Thiomicrorhabdus heinhorstiae]
MKKLLIGATLIASAVFAGTASASAMSYDETVAQAKAVHADASKDGFIWQQKKMKMPYVNDYLAKADEAHKKGDSAAAMKFAQEALKTAKAEVYQRDHNANLKAGWEK